MPFIRCIIILSILFCLPCFSQDIEAQIELLITKSQIKANDKDFKRANFILKKALLLDKKNIKVWREIAKNFSQLGHFKKATRVRKKIVDLRYKSKRDKDYNNLLLSDIFELAQSLLNWANYGKSVEKDYHKILNKAEKYFDICLEKNFNKVNTLLAKTQIYIQRKDFHRAFKTIKEMEKTAQGQYRDQVFSYTYYLRTSLYNSLGEFPLTYLYYKKSLEKFLKTDPQMAKQLETLDKDYENNRLTGYFQLNRGYDSNVGFATNTLSSLNREPKDGQQNQFYAQLNYSRQHNKYFRSGLNLSNNLNLQENKRYEDYTNMFTNSSYSFYYQPNFKERHLAFLTASQYMQNRDLGNNNFEMKRYYYQYNYEQHYSRYYNLGRLDFKIQLLKNENFRYPTLGHKDFFAGSAFSFNRVSPWLAPFLSFWIGDETNNQDPTQDQNITKVFLSNSIIIGQGYLTPNFYFERGKYKIGKGREILLSYGMRFFRPFQKFPSIAFNISLSQLINDFTGANIYKVRKTSASTGLSYSF